MRTVLAALLLSLAALGYFRNNFVSVKNPEARVVVVQTFTLAEHDPLLDEVENLFKTKALSPPHSLEACVQEILAKYRSDTCEDKYAQYIPHRSHSSPNTSSVELGIISNPLDPAVIKIGRFEFGTPAELETTLKSLQRRGVKKVILDLRNSPGGWFESMVQILSFFAPEGRVFFQTKSREGEEVFNRARVRAVYLIEDFGRFRSLKTAILINRRSASAAEIFAGVMKEWGYPVVGEKSFGKGVAQTQFTLIDGSILVMTTKEILVGERGVRINEIGVFPSFVVEKGEGERDSQLEKAIEVVNSW